MEETTDLGTCLVSLFCTQTLLLISFVTLLMGDTLFDSFSFSLFFLILFLSPFCTHTLFLKQLLRLPQHTHSHTRSSAQCLGNTRKATLDRIDTQKEDWISKVARYTFGRRLSRVRSSPAASLVRPWAIAHCSGNGRGAGKCSS